MSSSGGTENRNAKCWGDYSIPKPFQETKAPFVVYADVECLTVPIDVKSKSAKAKTTSYQNHHPCGFLINVANAITGSSEPYLYRGEDCMDNFVEKSIKSEKILLVG